MEHTTPSEEIFNEIKNAAITVWNTKDNTYGYVDKKLEIVNRIKNYADNVMVCYRMFDYMNQMHMVALLSPEAVEYIVLNN